MQKFDVPRDYWRSNLEISDWWHIFAPLRKWAEGRGISDFFLRLLLLIILSCLTKIFGMACLFQVIPLVLALVFPACLACRRVAARYVWCRVKPSASRLQWTIRYRTLQIRTQ